MNIDKIAKVTKTALQVLIVTTGALIGAALTKSVSGLITDKLISLDDEQKKSEEEEY